MSNLIPIHTRRVAEVAVQMVQGRDLYAFLGVSKDYTSWAKAQIKRGRLKEGRDFLTTQKGGEVFTPKGVNLGGRPGTEYYFTIEAGKHIGMMSNTAKGFEIREYFLACEAAARDLAKRQSDAYWQQRRLEGKSVRLALTDAVQEFVSYAKAQGSQSAEKYYMTITKMEYSALELVKQASDKSFRDTLDAVQHTQLAVIEMACQEALRQGMEEGLLYKDIYQMAKAACVQLAGQLRKYIPTRAMPVRALAA